MAYIGLRKPRVAKYSNTGTTVTYSEGRILAAAIEHEISLDNSEPVILYADDGARETAGGFSSGTLTLNVDDLPIEMAGFIYGIEPETVTEPAGSVISFDDVATPPYLGYGVIVPAQRNNVKIWRAILLTKVKFNVTGDSFVTRGETVEFQTPELTATIMRDDSASHGWRKYADFGTEEAADAWLNAQLGITA